MSEHQANFEIISKHVFLDKMPMTYKCLSRQLDITNTSSRQLLQEYYDQFKPERPELSSRFVITGKLGQDSLVKVALDTEVETIKQSFDSIYSCNIYSLNCNDQLSFGNITAINKTLKSDYRVENCQRWGIIQCPTGSGETIHVTSQDTLAVEEVKKETPQPTSSRPSERSSVSEPIKPSKSVVAKESNTTLSSTKKSNNAEKKKQQNTISFANSKRSKTEEPKSVEAENETKSQKTPVEPLKKKAKVETEEEKTKRLQRQEELAKMFEDDEDFTFDESAPGTQKTEAAKPESIDVEMEDAPASPILIEEEVEPAKSDLDDTPPAEVEAPPAEPTNESQEDTESYYDEDGYLVIKKKQAPPPVKKPAAPKKYTVEVPVKDKNPGKGVKKQSNLMSFFGKKK
ncbi:hypothetical protein CANARDRAFT_27396 [[Candida] arabinofermentans NRRL YB-2248]|uniref:DNA polymerase delta subunit 3 n=1 Tax=[Candida] arabinofermentans NRRL YB-2248 TaxID=983967 RepID=A0A1E4T308_9ASCO|nr:hypothetical protein CANARDRAFT_27396 [[Candida] arabinofermentans NRRL YB-2248]